MSGGRSGLRGALAGPVLWGGGALALFFLGFGGFAASIPLDAAATAPGVFVTEGSRRVVQSADSGVIAAIAVRDGQVVRRGQELVRLISPEVAARRALLRVRALGAGARLERLDAVRAGTPLAFSRALRELARQTGGEAALANERAIHASELAARAAEETLFARQADMARAREAGLERVLAALRRQSASLAGDRDAIAGLVAKGAAPRTRLSEIEREIDRIAAAIAQNELERDQAALSLLTNEAERRRAEQGRARAVGAEQREALAEREDARERLRLAENSLERLVLRAPVDGKVIDLRFDTLGGVVQSGAPVLDIVPIGERLVVEARISPLDIDRLAVGQRAQVHLTALPQRFAAPLDGVVERIAADRSADEQGGEGYFLARVAIDRPEADAGLPADQDFTAFQTASIEPGDDANATLPLRVGMPVEISVTTAEQTLLDALLEPLAAIWRRALREQQ